MVTLEHAAMMLGVTSRTFWRLINRYEDDGMEGLMDKRINQASSRRAPTDRGSHYWHILKEGGKVSKTSLTQVGCAMRTLGIQMIPSYSPEARGRSERAFHTHKGRLPNELHVHGITTIEQANQYIQEVYLPAFNAEFIKQASESAEAFISWVGRNLDDVLCEHHERTVGNDNCVSHEGIKLQIPADQYRCHYVKSKVRVHKYSGGSLAVFRGPRKLADYDSLGELIPTKCEPLG